MAVQSQEDLSLLAGVDSESASELEFPNGEDQQQQISAKEVSEAAGCLYDRSYVQTIKP